MIVNVSGADSVGAKSVENAICMTDATGREPNELGCIISRYSSLDADTY